MLPLTTALSKLLNCKVENLAEYLNNPEAVNKASVYLRGKKLKTTYASRTGITKDVEFGNFSLKSAADTYAFEGFLGKFTPYHTPCILQVFLQRSKFTSTSTLSTGSAFCTHS